MISCFVGGETEEDPVPLGLVQGNHFQEVGISFLGETTHSELYFQLTLPHYLVILIVLVQNMHNSYLQEH